MTPALATTDLAEDLIRFIMNAVTISDDQKDEYLKEIFSGKIPQALQGDGLRLLSEQEKVAALDELEAIGDAIALTKNLQNEEEQTVAVQAGSLVEEHTSENSHIVAEYNQDCSNIERGLDREIQTDVRSGEVSQADAIRAMLKQKPDTQA